MKDSDRIQRLIAEYELRISQLRGTLALLDMETNGRGRPPKHRGASTAMSAAIAADAKRRGNGNGNATHGKYVGEGTKGTVKERRARTAELLDQYDTHEPRNIEGAARMGLGSLVRRGYLRAKGDGYVRTAKEYVP